jgi:hypothetical protein
LAALERWQTAYLPVYSAWAAFVVIAFPPLFSYVLTSVTRRRRQEVPQCDIVNQFEPHEDHQPRHVAAGNCALGHPVNGDDLS